MTVELPPIKEVRDLLGELLGRDIDMVVSDAWAPQPLDMAAVAEFIDDHLGLQALALLDLPLAVYCGAAVGLVPAGGAQDMVDERDPSPMMLENLYEVLNILSSVFNVPANPHVKIGTLHEPGSEFPPDVRAAVGRPVGRLDLVVNIDGYGKGRLALVVA